MNRKILKYLPILFVTAAFFACATKVQPPVEKVQDGAPVVEKEEPVVVKKEPPAPTKEELEFERSINGLDISIETFNDDKAAILEIINELEVIMKEYKYDAWYSYLEKESAQYYSLRPNLQKASRKLPIKGQRLNSLKDYFVFVFVPARVEHNVDEIRYESESHVKVVQVKTEEDGTTQDVVYYNFRKVDGKWKVVLPPITD